MKVARFGRGGGAVGERGEGVFAGREPNLPTGEFDVVFGPQVPQRGVPFVG